MNRRTAGRYGPPRGETGKGMVFMLKEGEVRIPSGCAISGVFHKDGAPRTRAAASWPASRPCTTAPTAWAAGLPGYGIYPEYQELLRIPCVLRHRRRPARGRVRGLLERHFDVDQPVGTMPTRPIAAITGRAQPYGAILPRPLPQTLLDSQAGRTGVRGAVRHAGQHGQIGGAYVFSCGKNMGVFKAVGYPEDVGGILPSGGIRAATAWTAHGRYPTNTPGWWGGAHPFAHSGLSPWCTTARSPPMTQTAASSRCTATTAACSPIPRSSPISSIILVRAQGPDAGRSGRRDRRPVLEHHRAACPKQQRERLTYLRRDLRVPAHHRAVFHPAGLRRAA